MVVLVERAARTAFRTAPDIGTSTGEFVLLLYVVSFPILSFDFWVRMQSTDEANIRIELIDRTQSIEHKFILSFPSPIVKTRLTGIPAFCCDHFKFDHDEPPWTFMVTLNGNLIAIKLR